MASAAELQILLKGKDEASKSMEGVGKSTDAMAKKFTAAGAVMTAAGAAILGSLGLVIRDFTAAGDEVQKMALRTGFGTEALSELKFAAQISGASLTDIEKATKRQAKALTDADRGLETSARSFEELGLNVEDLTKLSPEEQFFAIAGALGDLEDQTRKSAIAQEIFGKSGTQLLPLFAQSADSIAALREQARDMGLVFDQEAADKAANLADAMTTLKGTLDGVKITIATQLVPALIPIIEKIQEIIGRVSAWTKGNPELTKKIVLAVAAIGGLLAVLGPIFLLLPGIIAALPLIAGGFALLLGPVGLVILAVGALVTAGIVLKDNWDVIMKGIKQTSETVINFVIDKINNLISALNLIPGVNIGKIGRVGTEKAGLTEGLSGSLASSPLPPSMRFSTESGGRKPELVSVIVNNNVQGSVIAEDELGELMRDQLIDIQNRNTTTGIQ